MATVVYLFVCVCVIIALVVVSSTSGIFTATIIPTHHSTSIMILNFILFVGFFFSMCLCMCVYVCVFIIIMIARRVIIILIVNTEWPIIGTSVRTIEREREREIFDTCVSSLSSIRAMDTNQMNYVYVRFFSCLCLRSFVRLLASLTFSSSLPNCNIFTPDEPGHILDYS